MFETIETIRFNCTLVQDVLFPKDDGKIEIVAKFNKLTYEKFNEIEVKINKNEYTLAEVKQYYLQNLISINILDDLEDIYRLPYNVVNRMIDLYMEKAEISDDEETILNKQSSIVFSGKPVLNACDGIGLYCLLTSFYEKFGMTLNDIKELPYKQFLILKLLISKESEVKSNEHRRSASRNSGKGTRIAGVKTSGPPVYKEMD